MQVVKKKAIYLHPKETIISNNTFVFPSCCPKEGCISGGTIIR